MTFRRIVFIMARVLSAAVQVEEHILVMSSGCENHFKIVRFFFHAAERRYTHTIGFQTALSVGLHCSEVYKAIFAQWNPRFRRGFNILQHHVLFLLTVHDIDR